MIERIEVEPRLDSAAHKASDISLSQRSRPTEGFRQKSAWCLLYADQADRYRTECAIAGPENTLLAAWANGKQAILLDPGRNQPTRPAGTIDRGEAATRGLAGRPCAARGWRSQTSFIAMEHTGVKPMPGM